MRREVLHDLNSTRTFARSADVVVLYVGPSTSLDETIASHFDTEAYESQEFSGGLVHGNRQKLGLPPGYDVLCGYYLFVKGVNRGYDPGTPRARETAERIIRCFDALVARFRQNPDYLDWPITPAVRASNKRADETLAPSVKLTPLVPEHLFKSSLENYLMGVAAGQRDRNKK